MAIHILQVNFRPYHEAKRSRSWTKACHYSGSRRQKGTNGTSSLKTTKCAWDIIRSKCVSYLLCHHSYIKRIMLCCIRMSYHVSWELNEWKFLFRNSELVTVLEGQTQAVRRATTVRVHQGELTNVEKQ